MSFLDSQLSSFIDISPAQDRSMLKQVLQNGTVDLDFTDDSYVQYKMFVDQPFDPYFLCHQADSESFLLVMRFGNTSYLEIIRTLWKTMKKGEISRFYLKNLSNCFSSISFRENKMVKMEMIGLIEEDITPNKDKGVLRQQLELGVGSTFPDVGDKVNCSLICVLFSFPLDEQTVEFNLGEGSEIGIPLGVELALMQMKLYEKCRLVIRLPYALPEEISQKVVRIVENYYEELIYEVRLNKFESPKNVHQLSHEDRFRIAKKYKEKGNGYFKRQQYDMAIKFYNKIIEYLGPVNEQDIPIVNGEKTNQMLVIGYLNLAQTFLNTGLPLNAIKNCDLALQIDPLNVKAHYRKGLAGVRIASVEFEKVLHLDSKNLAAAKGLALCQQLV